MSLVLDFSVNVTVKCCHNQHMSTGLFSQFQIENSMIENDSPQNSASPSVFPFRNQSNRAQ